MADKSITITWLGHATWLYERAGGERILIDPWIEENPKFPADWKDKVTERLDAIALTHGHSDHIDDLIQVAQRTDAPILCIYDIVPWLTQQGLAATRCMGFNLGGTVNTAGVKFTMVPAFHSSSHTGKAGNIIYKAGNIIYMGEAVGYVLDFEDGPTIYHTGDTCVFGDMKLIAELYRPDAAVMPIGDWFTMGPKQAAYAAKLIGAKQVIPSHFGTFPMLTGTPEEFKRELGEQDVEVVVLEPGQSATIAQTT